MTEFESVEVDTVVRDSFSGKLYRVSRAVVVSDDEITAERGYALEAVLPDEVGLCILAREIGPHNKFEVVRIFEN
ncbi:MAG: hypothetical protein BGO01_17255 [Armatimonadetes bacterium 55-13]|nr:hypothetical protein [Armatimonadota bacterium]OJU63899.1 MAG: hypothetical protein BGO01_17255 [Armatimonadetes bacterium 55-13]